METSPFRYQPVCSAPGCENPAAFKVAAPWSNGTLRELKTYGLACEEHRAFQLARGRSHREGLAVAENESLGQVGLYRLAPGVRDAGLTHLADDGTDG